MTSAYAPFATSYVQKTPYISAQELFAYPNALSWDSIIPGNAEANLDAVNVVLGHTTSFIDGYCCGAWGTLAATQNVENARIWGTRQGTIPVHSKYWPVISVDAFSYSVYGFGLPSFAASVDPSTSVWIEPQQFIVQPQGVVGFGLNAPAGITTTEYMCQWTYTNGWPNTHVGASVAAGSASIEAHTLTGIYPGTHLRIEDVPNNEAVNVASTYVIGTNPLILEAPLQYDHQTTAILTNIPETVKEAAVLVASAFVKQPGYGGLQVSDMSGVQEIAQTSPQGGAGDLALAKSLLDGLVMRYVGY